MLEEEKKLSKALQKVADYLSRRSHSQKELFVKLSKNFSILIVEQALEIAKKKNWLECEDELSQKELVRLNKKNKSWKYIKNQLQKQGLPLPEYNQDKELEKAKNLIFKENQNLKGLSFEKKNKLRQFLAYRGFEAEIIEELFSEII